MVNQQSPYEGLRELALFAGAGGGILGGHLLGWRTICAVEYEPYPASVLVQRQNDGILPAFPVWDDVRTFDGKPWRGRVDVVSGGFPCQDISSAGRGAGIDGERSGLWGEMARIIGEVRPRYAFVENSPILTSRGLGRVLGDVAEMGYNAECGVLGASDAAWLGGNPAVYHDRFRIWILAKSANADCVREPQQERREQDIRRWAGDLGESSKGSDSTGKRQSGQGRPIHEMREAEDGDRETGIVITNRGWSSEPSVGRVANGLAGGVDQLKALGNGQVSCVAAAAFDILARRINQ